MEKQGVDLLLGSDAPQIFNVPGFSIQHEMQAMADAGLSNYTILRSGTANPARFFGQEGEYGVVQEGAAADLILLSANPLEDIRHMQNPQGVMVSGQWMDRAFLDEKLSEIEAKYENE
jgi:imidazolonepropionase-like amidohydrolase